MAEIIDIIPGGATAEVAAKLYYQVHLMQLFYIYQSGNLLVNTSKLFSGKTLTQAQKDAFNKQIAVTKKVAINWITQQQLIEADGSPKLGITVTMFFSAAGLATIKNILTKLSSEPVSGIGFIPLLVLGVIALIALWGVFKIVARFTTTVADKNELLATTAQTAKDLGLTPEQAAGLLSQTQAEASDKGGFITPLLWLGGGFLALKAFTSFQTSTSK